MTIASPKALVLRDHSALLAKAVEQGGSGGRIEINARALVVTPDSTIDASAPGGPELQGQVVINSPEVTTNETVQRPETAFADPASLIRPSCVAREGQGSFRVARRRGLPMSPEGLLIPFDDLGVGAPLATADEEASEGELPPVAAGPSSEKAPPPPMQVALAQGAFRGGQFEAAKARWAQVAVESDSTTRGTALRGLAQSQLALGEYSDSIVTLQEALNLAEASGDAEDIAAAVGALAPVYLDLVDALLQGSERMSDAAESQALLRSARSTMEQLKAAELRNYFRNECVAELEARARPLEEVSANTAIVYPILLPDRIELLVATRDAGLTRYPVAVDAPTVRQTVLRLRQELQTRTSWAHRKTAQELYRWLVAPYAEALDTNGIDTLVFVPDGVLRTIPTAALHDGERYLVERYALAVAPSLSLVDPTPLDLERSRLLLGGVSAPRQLAGRFFQGLPYVPAELEEIQARYGGELLLDADFETQRLEAELDQAPPSIVHLATHAVFTGDAETSFIVTHDGKLTIDELGEAVGRSRFAEDPLELLMLSACQTAAGDERAALGLAGVAVRAGARSAFGSLWSGSDEAAYEAVVAFYAALEQPGTTKARALQRAQQQLLARSEFAHPFYWAPFLLISNWL